MSLKYRQLTRMKDAGQRVSLRLIDATTIDGILVDVDETDLCIRTGVSEHVIPLSNVIDIQTTIMPDNILKELAEAQANNRRVELTLKTGDRINDVEVIDLEGLEVQVRNHSQERIISVDQIERVTSLARVVSNVFVNPSVPPIPKASAVSIEAQTILYPVMRSKVALLEQELKQLAWPIVQFPELVRECPVSTRIHRDLGTIWSRALNYDKDRSWQRAADEFARFAAQKMDSFEACYNAGVCLLKLSDYRSATAYFEYAIEREANRMTLLAGIVAGNQAQYWHKSLAWMLNYFELTQGADAQAYVAVDFGLKFGMYRSTLQTIARGADAQFPLDWMWICIRLAYVAIRHPNTATILLEEMERTLISGQVDRNTLSRIVEGLTNIALNSPVLEYRNAEAVEAGFLENNPSLSLKRINALKEEIEDLRKQYRFHDAKERVQELLMLSPQDSYGQRALKDLEMRLAPPPPLPYRSRTYGESNTTYNAAKKAEQKNDLDKAISLYKKCISGQESKWQSAVMDLASISLRQGHIDVGVKFILQYKDSLDQTASSNMLGALYFKGGNYEDAVSAYQTVLELKSNARERVGPMLSIAMIRIRQDKLEEAERVLRNVLKLQPAQPAAKGLLESIITGTIQAKIGNVEVDKEGYLNLSRAVGVGAVGIGEFLEAELTLAEITGLDREIIVNERFSLKDIDYLLGRAGRFGKGKPEQVAQHCISAAKVLDILNQRSDDRFPESLRRFCAAQADYYAIKNFDVARTYYVESFRLENTITTQLRIKFVQLLMTFLCEPQEFLDSEPKHSTESLLQRGLTHQDPVVRKGIAFSILNVTRKNTDLLVKLEEHLRRSVIRNAMIRTLADVLGRKVETPENESLEDLIVAGQQLIEKSERDLQERFKWFLDNSGNAQFLYDLYDRFGEWKPNFGNAGVDFGGRDTDRIERMKDILRYYVRFMNETVFEEKDNLRNAVITQIERLQQDIHQFPTYYSRCYMLSLLTKWQAVVVSYFDEIASVSKPNLEVVEVAKAINVSNEVSAHLIVSNEQGKSAASGIKLEVLKSTSGDYEILEPNFEFGKTLRANEQATVVVKVKVVNYTPAFTLNYRLSYMDRQGNLQESDELSIAVRLNQAEFNRIENPYARWASSNEVTDPKMFFGRDHLVNELIELFSVPGQRKMIVIHGQKRAGKSSILYHVKDRMDGHGAQNNVLLIAFKMSIGDVITSFSLSNFFYVLARELHKSIKDRIASSELALTVTSVGRTDFQEDPFNQFLEYTEDVTSQLAQAVNCPVNLLMIIDEYTYVYELIQKGSLDINFMKAWKALVERHLFSFLLSGIDEMPEFVKAFPNEFAVADLRRVSYLDSPSSKNLIEKPVWDEQNNSSRFQERAIQRIQELTGNSAYYIQIFNNQLIDYMNEEKTDYVTEADVDAVMKRLTYGRHSLNLASNFDNLTRFKNSDQDTSEVTAEGKLLRLIAFLTKNDNFAHRDSIMRRFKTADHSLVERLIGRLIDREVIRARSGSQQYAFVVDLFKEWLNANLPYEEGMSND